MGSSWFFKIKKVGENGEVLAGAVFEVFNANNESVGKITTGADGMAELNNLPIGTYTLKEIKAPTGYVSDDKTQTIEVKTGETGAVQIVNNKVKGNIEIKSSVIQERFYQMLNSQSLLKMEKKCKK